jgi:hypothetical protein
MNTSSDKCFGFHQPVEYLSDSLIGCLSDNETLSIRSSANREYACFAIWEGGRAKEKDVIEGLREKFDIVADFLIHWSDKHYSRNIQRLYQRPGIHSGTGYDKKIGKPPFRFVIVEDKNPSYAWMRSVSGLIEPSNRNVVEKKYEFRSWYEREYQVHSSNNIGEFYFQAILILGEVLLYESIRSRDSGLKVINKDLEGAEGWKDWSELLKVLNFCSNYLVLRNFDHLPKDASEGDVDFLCDNYQLFASAANIFQKAGRTYKGVVEVSGARIPVDIRFVGDGYYSAAWQKDMLRRRLLSDGMYVPSVDDYFFSILYHCKIHKKTPSLRYQDLLQDLAERMRFDWFLDVDLHNDAMVAEIIKGYMGFNNYYYEKPIDHGVYENKDVVSVVKQTSLTSKGGASWKRVLKRGLRPLLLLRRRVLLYLR